MQPGDEGLLTPAQSGVPTMFNVFAHHDLEHCLLGKSIVCSMVEEVLVKPPCLL